jgi:biotin carboxyl carrier protein
MQLVSRIDGREERIEIRREQGRFRVLIGEREYEVDSERTGADLLSLLIDGRQFEVAVRRGALGKYQVASAHIARTVEVTDPLTFLARQGRGGGKASSVEEITAYMPGRVTSIFVAAGEEVEEGQGLLVLEAMKMENEIQAPHDAKVVRVAVEAGQTVVAGSVLFELG